MNTCKIYPKDSLRASNLSFKKMVIAERDEVRISFPFPLLYAKFSQEF